MFLQRIRNIVGDAGFEPWTYVPEAWCVTNEPLHLQKQASSFTHFNPKPNFLSTIIHKTPPISFARMLNAAKQNGKGRLVTTLRKTQYLVGLSLLISL